jgi:hypothetical protein
MLQSDSSFKGRDVTYVSVLLIGILKLLKAQLPWDTLSTFFLLLGL